jgi:uncharacterized protein
MIFLLSPAKALDETSELPTSILEAATPARFTDQAAKLIRLLKRFAPAELSALMGISDKLAELNTARYARWRSAHTAANSRPAALMFNGDVYAGLQAPSLTAGDWAWAQSHVAILSGLYGVLRPLDSIQPHRLEMGTALAHAKGRNLYSFWGAQVAQCLNEQLAQQPAQAQWVVNLASQEYVKVVDRQVLQAPVLDCVFEDWKNDRYKVIGLFAKRARGLMARFAIESRVTQPEMLQKFTLEGYGFDAAASAPLRWVFRRRVPGVNVPLAASGF